MTGRQSDRKTLGSEEEKEETDRQEKESVNNAKIKGILNLPKARKMAGRQTDSHLDQKKKREQQTGKKRE